MFEQFRNKYASKIPLYTSIFVGIAIFGIAAFYTGYETGISHPKIIELQNITNTGTKEGVTLNFGTFWEAWDMLKRDQLNGAKAEDQKLLYGAISGLVDSLGDPHTIFLPPAESKKFEQDVIGNFGGIGAEIGMKDKILTVIAPLKNNPAEAAGLLAGDKILAIDGKPADGLGVNSAVEKIRGEIGTTVTLTLFREGWDKTKDFKIVRATIIIPTLETKMITKDGKKIAHISLFSFNQNAPLGFYKEALTALANKSDGIILDMRNNPGGFLEVAINLAGWFVDKGQVIAKERFRSGKENEFRADGNAALKNIPLVILVNKGSASASEILAGALHAIRGTKLVGTNTYGKGTVQELRGLSDGSQIKLTIANWVLPNGEIISEEGIVPDIKVEITDKDIEKKLDSQLEKAEEVLLQEINK